MTFLIKAENISVVRNGKAILDSVSLDVRPGDFTTIVGPNGAGKTTLLKVLMGLINVDFGSVRRKPGLRVGYVPQRLAADESMPITVRRFLTLRKKAAPGDLERVVTETGIGALLGKSLHVLSGGELQRLLMARALLDDPDVLILDEPAQNLDVAGQLALYRLIDNVYSERRLAVVMVSHDLHLVMSSTRHVVCLYHHISCRGTPHTITRDPAFKSVFGEDMARLMAVYTHAAGEDHFCETHDHTRHEHSHEGDGS
ncbi:MAG: ATP-binding cassette domain-containing protein [Alphaproteobacteria bacterium]|nr:ATP-binding cassette domain-containing protein [Alphaproteobacteria bacterium]